jgi:ribonuclease VapC
LPLRVSLRDLWAAHGWVVTQASASAFGSRTAGVYIQALAATTDIRMSAAAWVESAAVVDANRDPVLSGRFDDLITEAGVTVEPVTAYHARLARQAYRDFGKGNHPAVLNFGDCFSYALARATGEPLLFKGNDFALTDVAAIQ